MSIFRLMFGTLADYLLCASVIHLRYLNFLWRLLSFHYSRLRFKATCPRLLLLFFLLLGNIHGPLVSDHLLNGLQGLDHLLLVEVLRADRLAEVRGVAWGGAVVRENLQRTTAISPQRAGVTA